MVLFALSYLAGALTILAPCILPILPFVFARVDQPFARSGLPLLAGMAVTFAGVATLAAVGGAWAVEANQYGRIAAIALLGLLGVALVAPRLADRWTRPLVAIGSRLSDAARRRAQGSGASVLPSFMLGAASGLLWAPCAGPILGLVLTTAALQGASVGTSLLLLAYAAGAATSLALAVLVGGRVFSAMKQSLGIGEQLRRGLGVAVLAGVAAVALGLDTGGLSQLSFGNAIEDALLSALRPRPDERGKQLELAMPAAYVPTVAGADASAPANPAASLPVEGDLPALTGVTEWLNSPPLTAESLRGKVVLIDFWTYSCINCLHALPHVREWAQKYKDQGLVVIGVHAPEFAYERNIGNVERAVRDLGISFPVAIDNDFVVWRSFGNQYWPAHYFIDAQGRIRFHRFGEGEYERSEQVIRQLLEEARTARVANGGLGNA
jgi:cytochrome c biogenesis protein CcdA/thiol-disulfide isomerase/thioredoxin